MDEARPKTLEEKVKDSVAAIEHTAELQREVSRLSKLVGELRLELREKDAEKAKQEKLMKNYNEALQRMEIRLQTVEVYKAAADRLCGEVAACASCVLEGKCPL